MESKQLRPIKYTLSSGSEWDGVFHTWGNEYDYNIGGIVTVGIIETSQGSIIALPPYRIKFKEPIDSSTIQVNNQIK